MNKLFYALGTLALCAACNQVPKPFVLEGTLKNCRSDYALLVNGIIGLRDTIRIAPDGTFSFQTVLKEPAFAFVSFSQQDAVGTVLTGQQAVHEGLIDQLGSLNDALDYLYGEIERRG